MDKKFTVRPQIEVNLTQQDIDDIMFTALEDGITYWCCLVEVVGDYLGKYASDQISRGGMLKLYDSEANDHYWLDCNMFLEGVKLYYENGCHVSIEDNSIDTSDIDANDADCIIQFALFGEVVYG